MSRVKTRAARAWPVAARNKVTNLITTNVELRVQVRELKTALATLNGAAHDVLEGGDWHAEDLAAAVAKAEATLRKVSK